MSRIAKIKDPVVEFPPIPQQELPKLEVPKRLLPNNPDPNSDASDSVWVEQSTAAVGGGLAGRDVANRLLFPRLEQTHVEMKKKRVSGLFTPLPCHKIFEPNKEKK